MTERQANGGMIKKGQTLLLLHDASCLFAIWRHRPSGPVLLEKSSLRTINQHLHVAVHAACNLQHLGRRHFRLFLSKLVQPLQGILDIVPAQ